jgi:hypothetical protein
VRTTQLVASMLEHDSSVIWRLRGMLVPHLCDCMIAQVLPGCCTTIPAHNPHCSYRQAMQEMGFDV